MEAITDPAARSQVGSFLIVRRLFTLAAVTALLASLWAVPAVAAGKFAADPVNDCYANNTLTRHYTAAQLQRGLATMPADVREYSDCYDVLHRALMAQLAAAHGGSGGGGGGDGGGSILPAPVLAVLAALIVAAGGLGAVALRRRSAGDASG